MSRSYEPRVTFHTPDTEEGKGVVSNLSDAGLDLQTMERLAIGDEVELKLTLLLGKNPMMCSVSGTIQSGFSATKPLNGYRIAFDARLPTPTRLMIQKLTAQESEVVPSSMESSKSKSSNTANRNTAKDIVIDYGNDPLFKQSQSRRGADTTQMLWVLIVIAGLFICMKAGSWVFSRIAIGKIPSAIPVTRVDLEDGTMVIQVKRVWLLKDPSDRKFDLKDLIQLLHDKQYDSAIIQDDSGNHVGRVVLQRGSPPERAMIMFDR